MLFFALITTSCSSSEGSKLNFDKVVYKPTYASGFDITADVEQEALLFTVRNPWQGAKDIEQQFLLLSEGVKPPRDFEGQVVRGEIKRIVCLSSSHVALLDAVDQTQRIVGVSGIGYIANPRIAMRRKVGKVADIGYDAQIDFELLASLCPDLMLLYGIGGEDGILTGKLRELGIPYIYIGEYVEESPLGKAEWLVLTAALCGRLDEGRAVFEGIEKRYNTLRNMIRNQFKEEDRPTVMLNAPYRDTWYMPSAKSYMIRLVEDAGGKYIFPQNTSNISQAIDIEQAYRLAAESDIWINAGMYNNMEDLRRENPKFSDIPSVKYHRVWNNNRRQTPQGGSDFWESGVVRPDVILRDLFLIFSGADEPTTYYKQLR